MSKIDAFGYLEALNSNPLLPRKQGKVLLVTADTPLKASRGEGKTTTTIALVDALRAKGIDAAAVLRQPSMGITAAGSKGGASGGGKASLRNADVIDWGLCGEMAAIAAAQNLLVSFAEKAVDDGLLDAILVPRVSEVPSRALRQIAVDRGKLDLAERVILTPTCELMQIVILSRSMSEIGERVGKMIAGTREGQPVQFADFVEPWRIVGILRDAVRPVLTHTLQGSPVYIHGGPFANVSLGIPSLVSVDLACSLHDVVLVEAGYGADAGAQKWLDIAVREFGAMIPSAAIVVTRATTWQDDPHLSWRYSFHMHRLESLGIPSFPLVNLWDGEDDLVSSLQQQSSEAGFRSAIIGNLYRDGGEGLTDQLEELLDVLSEAGISSEFETGACGGGCCCSTGGRASVDEISKTSDDASADASPEPFGECCGESSSLAASFASSGEELSSRKGLDLLENIKRVTAEAYGVPGERVIFAPGFESSLAAAKTLCSGVGVDINDLALLAVKSPAVMTDNDFAPQEERTVTLKRVEPRTGAGLVHVNLTTSLTTPMPKIA